MVEFALAADARVEVLRVGAQDLTFIRRLDEVTPKARAVQPIFYINSANSRDNSPEAFNGIILPMLAELNPAPRVKATQLGAGTHIYYKPMPDLPVGLTRAAAYLWRQAIQDGFFMP